MDKRSTLIDAQKTEIIALKIQVETLEARLKWASNDRDVQNLENRLVEQSRRLNEGEFELKYLRDEIEVAQKAEADLRRGAISQADDKALQSPFRSGIEVDEYQLIPLSAHSPCRGSTCSSPTTWASARPSRPGWSFRR